MRMVWTLEAVAARCETEGKCWIWNKALNGDGYPVASVQGKARHMPRFVFTELLGRALKPNQRVTSGCGNYGCLSPDCLRAVTKGATQRIAYSRGRRILAAEIVARRRVAKERGMTKLSFEVADQIRARDGARTDELAAEFGVSKTTINKVRRGDIWNRLVTGSSVFNWRPA